MPNRRLERLNEQFRREITGILHRSVRDPRVTDVVVTGVAVTSDLWLARVYVRVSGEDADRDEALKGLEGASNFIRRELGSMLHIRRIPELRFLEDETLDQATRIEEILREIVQEEQGEQEQEEQEQEEQEQEEQGAPEEQEERSGE